MALSNANEYVQGLYGAQYPVMASALLLPPTIKAYDPFNLGSRRQNFGCIKLQLRTLTVMYLL